MCCSCESVDNSKKTLNDRNCHFDSLFLWGNTSRFCLPVVFAAVPFFFFFFLGCNFLWSVCEVFVKCSSPAPLAFNSCNFPGRSRVHSHKCGLLARQFSKSFPCWSGAPVLSRPAQRDLCVCYPTTQWALKSEERLGDGDSQWAKC